jgi:hypothetical protein
LIATKNTFEHDVAQRIRSIDEVIDVEPLMSKESLIADPFFKEYKLMAKIKVNESTHNIGLFVNERIHTVKGVTKTKIVSR